MSVRSFLESVATSFMGRAANPAAEVARAAKLKEQFLSPEYTDDDFYGPLATSDQAKAGDIMPDPDAAYAEFNQQDDKIYDRMQANVLDYAALVEGRIDVGKSLTLSFVAGEKGDDESEAARDEIEAAWEALENRDIVERKLLLSEERGFMAAENQFGVQILSGGRELITVVRWRNRPRRLFGFAYDGSPYFLRDGRSTQNPKRVDDYKVTFARAGSVDTDYGEGFGQRCYPTVWGIHNMVMGHMALVERFGYMPVEMHYPSKWRRWQWEPHYRNALANWKNILPCPDDDADGVFFKAFPTDAAYANASASGTQRQAQIDRWVRGLSFFIRGSMSSAGNQEEGSYARELVADEAQMWKAPTTAAVREAMVQRGFIEPTILVNHPTLERHKWPRVVVDASFGEDLRLLLELLEFAANHEIPVDKVIFAERTGIPIAAEGASVIAPSTPAVQPALPDPVEESVRRMSEPYLFIESKGKIRALRPDTHIAVREGSGMKIVRASKLQAGMNIVDPDEIRRAFRRVS